MTHEARRYLFLEEAFTSSVGWESEDPGEVLSRLNELVAISSQAGIIIDAGYDLSDGGFDLEIQLGWERSGHGSVAAIVMRPWFGLAEGSYLALSKETTSKQMVDWDWDLDPVASEERNFVAKKEFSNLVNQLLTGQVIPSE